MRNYLKNTIEAISLKQIILILFLSFIVINSIISCSLENDKIRLIFSNYLKSAILIFLCISFLFFIWIVISLYFKKDNKLSLRYSSIVLSPIILLLLWEPQETTVSFFVPIAIILTTQICFFIILSKQDYLAKINALNQKIFISVLIILYFSIFSYISIQKFNSFGSFNPKDFAIYNQTFWNTVNGRLFSNSTYGSNFCCHNSPFYFILIPFYYIFPHPLTLSILKILLLSVSVIPFYLIAKLIFKDISIQPLILSFMMYPFLVSQNFAPPHEICYLPFFLLFTYYFLRLNKFLPFMVFLILSLSIKEHLSLIAIMFGVYSLLCKKSPKWILLPILLGIVWFIFSIGIILHFQKVYQPHPDAAWPLVFLKTRFLSQKGSILNSILSGISYSNISNWHNLKSVFLLFFPLGIIAPLLSPVSLLGLPELIINLLSDRPAVLSPLRHYNIVVSCFLLIGTLEGVKRISHFKWVKNLKMKVGTFRFLLSLFILSSTLSHSYIWLGQTKYSKDMTYIKTVKEAIALIPKDAFITVPRDIAVHISSREKYSLIGEREYGDYILVDKHTSPFLLEEDIINNYTQIFNKEGILIFKKNN